MPLPVINYPKTPPPWLSLWPDSADIDEIFPPDSPKCQSELVALDHETELRLTWGNDYLTLQQGRQFASWRLRNRQWLRQCSCGYPNGNCPHIFGAAWLLTQVCRREGWLDTAGKAASPAATAGNSPSQSATTAPTAPHEAVANRPQPQDFFLDQKSPAVRQVQLQAEVDFRHEAGKVGLRVYVLENSERRLATLNNLICFANDCHAHKGNRAWPEADRRLLFWLKPFILKIPFHNWSWQMLTFTEEEFQQHRLNWEDCPGRFLERLTQKPLPTPGQSLPVKQIVDLVAEGDRIKVVASFVFANGYRRLVHEIFQQLKDDPNQEVSRRELFQFHPPVSWQVMRQYFSRKSPSMLRTDVVRLLPKLLENRLDIVQEGPCVRRHLSAASRIQVTCAEKDGEFRLTLLLDGQPVNLTSKELIGGKTRFWEEGGIFHLQFSGGKDEIREVREVINKLAMSAGHLEERNACLKATRENALRLRETWQKLAQMPCSLSSSQQLQGLLTNKQPRLELKTAIAAHGGIIETSRQWYVDDMRLDSDTVAQAVRQRIPAFRLLNGNWLSLDPSQAATAFQEAAKDDLLPGKLQVFLKREFQQQLHDGKFDEQLLADLDSRQTFQNLLQEPLEPLPELPASVKDILRHYQHEGFNFLLDRCLCGLGCILADDMGLGKTLQVLTALAAWRQRTQERGEPFRALVVCPATVISVWCEQARKFLPSLRVLPLNGSPDKREKALFASQADVLVTHYGLLRQDIENLLRQEFTFVVLDEAQNIKNPEARVTMDAKILHCQHRLALTGTPLENRPLDLWSIMDFLNPGYLGDDKSFREKYEDGEEFELLRDKLRPLLLRRTKAVVAAELPPRMVEVLSTDMAPGQARLYSQQCDLAKERTRSGDTMQILADLTKLRQICCDPQLFLKHPHDLGSGKLLTLLDRLEELLDAGHSVLVFSQFTSMLDIIRENLRQKQLKHWLITGDTPLPQRQAFVQEFTEDDEPGIFLLSLKAAGTGLTLTKADYVFIFDPWWNPAVEDQAIDRTHRIGQTKTVTAYRLIAANTIEERMLDLMARKKAIFQTIVDDASLETAFSRLSREDLRHLLDAD